jgi:hypothetical protein
MTRALLLLAMACGGSADSPELPEPGWCCDGLCGLWASETAELERCVCDAVVRRPEGSGRGECLTDPAQ